MTKAKACSVCGKAIQQGGSGTFTPSVQTGQWVAGTPFDHTGDPDGNANPILNAATGGLSSISYYQNTVQFNPASGFGAPIGTPFSPLITTGGGGGSRFNKAAAVGKKEKKKPRAAK